MGLELAKAFVTIHVGMDKLASGLASVKSAVTSAVSSISAGAAVSLVPAGLFGKGLITESLKTAAFFEKTEAELGVVMKSAGDAKQAIGSLLKLAIETPFEIPHVMDAGRQLASIGKSAEELAPTIRMLGDMVLGNEEKFSRLIYVYKEIQSQGYIAGNDFKQLSSTGAISAKFLAEAFKITESAAAKMMKSLTKDQLDKYFKIMTSEGGRFYKAMEIGSSTLSGLISKLKDTATYLKLAIGEMQVPAAKELVKIITDMSAGLAEIVKYGGEAASFAIGGAAAFAVLGASIAGAALAMKLLGISLATLLVGTGIGALFVAFGAFFGMFASYINLPERLSEGFQLLKESLSHNLIAANNFKVAFASIKAAGIATFEAIKSTVSAVASSLLGDSEIFKDGWLSGINVIAVRFSEWVMEMAEWAEVIANNWEGIWQNIGAITIVVLNAIFETGLGATRIFFRELEKIAEQSFKNMGQSLKDVAIGLIPTWKSALLTIAEFVFSLEDAFSSTVFSIMKNVIAAFETPIRNLAASLPAFIRNAAGIDTKSLDRIFTQANNPNFKPDPNKNNQIRDDVRKLLGSPEADALKNGEDAAAQFKALMADVAKNINDAIQKNKGLATLEEAMSKMKEAIEKQRASRLAPKGDKHGPENKPPGWDDKRQSEDSPMEFLKAGMYDIASFGAKLQEGILGKEDPAIRTNTLLEQGNEAQARMFTMLDKKLQPGLV